MSVSLTHCVIIFVSFMVDKQNYLNLCKIVEFFHCWTHKAKVQWNNLHMFFYMSEVFPWNHLQKFSNFLDEVLVSCNSKREINTTYILCTVDITGPSRSFLFLQVLPQLLSCKQLFWCNLPLTSFVSFLWILHCYIALLYFFFHLTDTFVFLFLFTTTF